jgi:hypothetical protein
MSGEPPPGRRHVATGRRVRKEITVIDPASRFDTYSVRESRLGYRPCAPRPVRSKRCRPRPRVDQPHAAEAMSAT